MRQTVLSGPGFAWALDLEEAPLLDSQPIGSLIRLQVHGSISFGIGTFIGPVGISRES